MKCTAEAVKPPKGVPKKLIPCSVWSFFDVREQRAALRKPFSLVTLINVGPSRLLNVAFLFTPALLHTHIYGKLHVSGAGSERGRRGRGRGAALIRYLQLLLLEHIRARSVEDVVGQLGLAVNVDRRGGFAGQEAVVDLSGALRELEEASEGEKRP